MSCRFGGTYCSLPGRIGSDGLYVWGGEIDLGDLRFCITSDDWRVSWRFRYLYIEATLWNMIQASLGSLYEALVLLNMNTFNNPVQELFFGIHYYPHFYSPTWVLPGNNSWSIFLGCQYHYTRTWRTLQRSETAVQHHGIPRVSHGNYQPMVIQLPMTPCLHLGKFVNLVYSFVLSTLQFLSPCPVISLLPQLYVLGGKEYYFGLLGRYSVEI